MDDPLNLGVVGFGKLGLLHAGLASGLPGCRLAAIADTSSTLLSMLNAQMPAVQVFERHTDMVEAVRLDGVFIATPTDAHVPIAVDLVRRGIAVFVEKPLAISEAAAAPLLEALRARPVVNMVGYMSRYLDTFAKAHEIVRSGALGKLQLLRSTMYISQLFRRGKGWRYRKETAGGGVLITQNSHLVDMLRWIFGEPRWVSANTARLYSAEVEDAVHAYLAFDGGLVGWMDTSWSMRHQRTLTMSISVQGEDGTLDFSDDQVRLYLDRAQGPYPAGWTTWHKPDLFSGVSIDLGGPQYTRQAEAFVAALRGKGAVESDVASAARVQRIIDCIYRSAAGRGVPVDV